MKELALPPSLSGSVKSVCTSARKGTQKWAVQEATLVPAFGLQGDAHAGPWHRQVSLLSNEDVDTMREAGLSLSAGAFGENLVTEGINLLGLAIGRRFRVGNDAVMQVTQHGKTCHQRCQIYYRAGDCIMPKRGIFARVLRGGVVRAGDVLTTESSLDRPRYGVAWLTDHRITPEERRNTLVEAALAPFRGAIVATWQVAPGTVDLDVYLRQLARSAVADVVFLVGASAAIPVCEDDGSEPHPVFMVVEGRHRTALADSIGRLEAQPAAETAEISVQRPRAPLPVLTLSGRD